MNTPREQPARKAARGVIEKPPWVTEDKEGSLKQYAAWLNEIARGALSHAGHHPEMFFFVTDTGEVSGCQIPKGLPSERKEQILRSEASRINPFGTIQVIVEKTCHPKLPKDPRFRGVQFAGAMPSDPDAAERDCLIVRMSTRTGKEVWWTNPFIREGDRVVLSEPVVVYPKGKSSVANIADAYFERAGMHLKKGDRDKAIRDFTKVIKINPAHADAYYLRGSMYVQKGEYDQAIEDCSKAIEVDPNHADAYFGRGAMYAQKGDYDQAIRDYNMAIEINPGYAEAYFFRGFAYARKGDYDQAMRECNKAIEINPRYAAAYYNRGALYKHKGDRDQAIHEYNKAIEINPSYAEAYFGRAGAHVGKGNYDVAIRDCTKAIKIDPRYAEAYWGRGVAYQFKGKYDKARADYKKACELGSKEACKQLQELQSR